MLKIFKQNIILQLAIIVIVVVALWWPAFVTPIAMQEAECDAPIYNLLYNLLSGTPILASAIALILILLESFLINEILYTNKLLQQSTLLPMLIYILAMSIGENNLTITPMLLVNLVVLLSFLWALSKTNLTISASDLFSVAAFVMIATMCYVPAITLVVPLLILIPTYKLYSWRDWVMMIFGLMAPAIPMLVYWFCTDNLLVVMNRMAERLTEFNFELVATPWVWIYSVVLLLLTIFVCFNGLGQGREQTLQIQKSTLVLAFPLIASLLMLCYGQILPFNTQLVAVSVAYFATTYGFSIKKRQWIFSIVMFTILVIGVIANL